MLSEEEINLWNAQNEQTARSARGSRHSKSSGHGSRQPSSVGSHPASFKGPPPMAPMAPSKVPSAKKSAVTRRGVKKVRGTSVWSQDEEDSDEEDSDEEDSDEEDSDEEDSDEEDSDEEDLDQEDSDEEHLSVSNHKNKRDDTRARTDPRHKRSPAPSHTSKRDDTRARKEPRHERSPAPSHTSKRDDTRARKEPRHERSPAPSHKSKRDDIRARDSVEEDSGEEDSGEEDSGEEDSGEEDSGEVDSSASNHKSGKGDGRARDSHYKGSVTSNHGSKQNKGRARGSDHFEKRDGESKNEMPQEPSSMKNGDQPRNSNPHEGPRGDDRKSVHADSVNGDTKSQKSTQFKANTPGWIRETKKPSKSIAGDSKKSPKSVVGYTRDRVGSSRSKSNHGDGKRDDDKSQRGGESGKKDIGKRDIGKSPESIKDGGRDGKRDDDKSQRRGESGKKDTGKRDTGKSPESIKDSRKDGKKGASSSADKSRASPLKDIQEDSEGSEELDLQRADARRPKKSATIASDTPSKEPEKPKRKGEYTRKTVPKGAKVISPTRGFARKPRPEDARWAWIDPKVKVDSKKRAEDWGYDA